MPGIFQWLQQQGNISEQEMLRTFNCGIGMVICVAKESAAQCLGLLKDLDETAWQLGHIETATADKAPIQFTS